MQYKYIVCVLFVNIFASDKNKNILPLNDLLTFTEEEIQHHYQSYIDNQFQAMSPDDQKKHDKLNKNHDKNNISKCQKYESYIKTQYDELLYIRNSLIKNNLGTMDDVNRLQKIIGLKNFIDQYIESIYTEPSRAYYNNVHNESHVLTYDTKHFQDVSNDFFISKIKHEQLQLYISAAKLYEVVKNDLSNILRAELDQLDSTLSQKVKTGESIIDKQRIFFLENFQIIIDNHIKEFHNKLNDEIKSLDSILDQKINMLTYNSWQLAKMLTVLTSTVYCSKQIYDFAWLVLEEWQSKKQKINKFPNSFIIDRMTYLKKCFYIIGCFIGVKYLIKKEKEFSIQ